MKFTDIVLYLNQETDLSKQDDQTSSKMLEEISDIKKDIEKYIEVKFDLLRLHLAIPGKIKEKQMKSGKCQNEIVSQGSAL